MRCGIEDAVDDGAVGQLDREACPGEQAPGLMQDLQLHVRRRPGVEPRGSTGAVERDQRRWWSDTCNRSVALTRSVEEAERRMAVTVARAWAATLLMAQSSATELVAVSSSAELAKDTVFEITHALGKIESLGLMPRRATTGHDATHWAKRVLRKGSPRLMKILSEQFVLFGGPGRPPGRA